MAYEAFWEDRGIFEHIDVEAFWAMAIQDTKRKIAKANLDIKELEKRLSFQENMLHGGSILELKSGK